MSYMSAWGISFIFLRRSWFNVFKSKWQIKISWFPDHWCVLTHTSTVCYLEYLTGGRRCGRKEMSWAAEVIRLKMNSTFQSGNIRHKLGEREEVERRGKKVGIGQIKPSKWYGVLTNHTPSNQEALFYLYTVIQPWTFTAQRHLGWLAELSGCHLASVIRPTHGAC